MGIADWLRIGLKLLGVYFFVDGMGNAVWAALVRLCAALFLLFGTDRGVRLIAGPNVEKLGDTRIRASTARDATNFSMDSEDP